MCCGRATDGSDFVYFENCFSNCIMRECLLCVLCASVCMGASVRVYAVAFLSLFLCLYISNVVTVPPIIPRQSTQDEVIKTQITTKSTEKPVFYGF